MSVCGLQIAWISNWLNLSTTITPFCQLQSVDEEIHFRMYGHCLTEVPHLVLSLLEHTRGHGAGRTAVRQSDAER